MRNNNILRARRRFIGTVLLVAVISVALVVVDVGRSADAQTVSDSVDAASSVRIAARKLDNGNIEFGLHVAGGELWLPRARFFSYATVEVGRWLRASPYGMSDGNDVRIRARKLTDGKVEFALQVGADRQWLPPKRQFPYDTANVGRWLYASWYTVGDPTTPLDTASPTAIGTTTPPDGSSCTFERTMSQILPSVFQVVVTTRSGTGTGTAFYVGNDEFLTAAHVVENARTIRLQNHERTFRQVQVVGVDTPSDVAILRADGSGVPAMRFGDESSLGLGARIAVVGYPLFETEGAPSIASGLLSSKLSDPEHGHVSYLQTDAAANPGNSGGPVVTACGAVIGLVVSKLVDEAVEGIIYAVSGTTIEEAVPRARRHGPAATEPSPGAWVHSVGAADGDLSLYTISEVYEYEDSRGNEDPPWLGITCISDELQVFVYWDTFVAANVWTEEIGVTFQFDDGDWTTEGWDELPPSYRSAWAPSPRSLVRSALGADEMTISVWNFDNEPVGIAIFRLEALDAGLSKIPCY